MSTKFSALCGWIDVEFDREVSRRDAAQGRYRDGGGGEPAAPRTNRRREGVDSLSSAV